MKSGFLKNHLVARIDNNSLRNESGNRQLKTQTIIETAQPKNNTEIPNISRLMSTDSN